MFLFSYFKKKPVDLQKKEDDFILVSHPSHNSYESFHTHAEWYNKEITIEENSINVEPHSIKVKPHSLENTNTTTDNNTIEEITTNTKKDNLTTNTKKDNLTTTDKDECKEKTKEYSSCDTSCDNNLTCNDNNLTCNDSDLSFGDLFIKDVIDFLFGEDIKERMK